ncbi:MAG: GntR family transcriptional regulator [Propionibacteriaceae bacterium]|nr:GntR family transcriptional regulator [Propionibacteriaceae bacterium]MDO5066888.1 GntR family transcriptional regulator [Propionibacteriaceae bacterium]
MSVDERKAHQVALDHIESELLTGNYPVGTKLPPERELAEQLGVSRGAVREAIRVLQAQGILESLPGPGRGTRTIAGHTEALGKLLRLHLAVTTTSAADLTETRSALERVTASLAARHRDTAALSRMAELVARMDDEEDLTPFNLLDTEFHLEIAQAARHSFIGDLTCAIRLALRDPIHRASVAMPNWQDLRATLCTQHRGILEAVTDGDQESAAERMDEHIRSAYAILKPEL